jgi:carboxymethylenebutenolidase
LKQSTRILAIIILLACVPLARRSGLGAVQHASPPSKTRTVQIKSGAETINGYLVLPDSPGRHPALIIVHEWWGLNDWVKEQTRKLADAGYVSLAVDLYRGDVASTLEEAHEISRGVPDDRALRDLEAGFAFLAARPDVDKTKIGTVGWCMGGGYALELAVNEPKLAACVVNYGAMPTDRGSIARIHAPVLGNFGAEDRGISTADVHSFATAMKSAGKSVDLKVYDGAGHAFANESIKESYHPAAAADAWNRTLAFLSKTLK